MLSTVPESLLSHYRSAQLAVPVLGALAGCLPDGTQAVDPENSGSKKMVRGILYLFRELQEIDSGWPATNEDINLAFASVSQCDSFDGPWRGNFSSVHSAFHSWVNKLARYLRTFEDAAEMYSKKIEDLIMLHYCLEKRDGPSMLYVCPSFSADAAMAALDLKIVAATELWVSGECDGPCGIGQWRHNGVVLTGTMQVGAWKMVKCLWEQAGHVASFDDLIVPIYDDSEHIADEVAFGALRREANRFFSKYSIPWSASLRRATVFLKPAE